MNQLPKQLRFKTLTHSKRMFANIFLMTTVILLVLPFWTSIQDLLTQLIMRFGWYRQLQNIIVPYEIRVIGTLLNLLKFPIRVGAEHVEWTRVNGQNEVIYLAWNCVGWQSLVLFVITLITGLSGKYSWVTKAEAMVIGILGTYLINIFRLILVVIIYFGLGRVFGIIFHDYFSNLLTLLWLGFFWQFAFRFVLEKESSEQD